MVATPGAPMHADTAIDNGDNGRYTSVKTDTRFTTNKTKTPIDIFIKALFKGFLFLLILLTT